MQSQPVARRAYWPHGQGGTGRPAQELRARRARRGVVRRRPAAPVRDTGCEQAHQGATARAERDDAGHGGRRRAAVDAHRADQGARCPRPGLVHQLRQPQGPRAGAHPQAALQFHWVELERVVRIEGRVEKVERRAVRRLLRQPSTRLAHRCLGLAAEPGDQLTRGAGGQRRQVRRASTAEPAATAALGRLSPGCPTAGSSGRAASSRLHDRLRYSLEAGRWTRERLAP